MESCSIRHIQGPVAVYRVLQGGLLSTQNRQLSAYDTRKALIIDWLTYVQNILHPSFVSALDTVRHIGSSLQCLCHKLALITDI